MSSLRFGFDVTACVAHAVTIGVGISTPGFVRSFTGLCLVAMECVTFLFHVWYITCNRGAIGRPRTAKWYEYGISATLGTIAILHTDITPRWDWIILFFLIGNAQQLMGLQLEHNPSAAAFVAGTMIQLGEYVFVGMKHSGVVFWTYVAFYGLFGVHALMNILNPTPSDYSEEVYSLFGFVAKLAVFYAEYAHTMKVRHALIITVSVCTFVTVVAYTLLLRLLR